jgi:hypothetical protein
MALRPKIIVHSHFDLINVKLLLWAYKWKLWFSIWINV